MTDDTKEIPDELEADLEFPSLSQESKVEEQKEKEQEAPMMEEAKARKVMRAFGDGFSSVFSETDVQKRMVLKNQIVTEVNQNLDKLLEAVIVGLKPEFQQDFGYMVNQYLKMTKGVTT